MDTLLADEGFRFALGLGAVATLVVLALARAARVQVGFATAGVVAALITFRHEYHVDDRLVVAVVVLALGGALARLDVAVVRYAAAVPGALLMVWAMPDGLPDWVGVVAFAVTAGAAPLASVLDRRGPRVAPPLFLVSAFGVYICVPDTEFPRILVGAFVAAACLAFERGLRGVREGVFAAVGVLVWTACVGGASRPGSVVGGVACIGVFTLVPLVAQRVPLANPWSAPAWCVAGIHVALVVWCARVAGFREDAAPAAALALVGYAVAAVILAALQRARTRPRSS